MKWYLKVLKQYADFSGRARRTEFWMFVLFNMIFSIVAGLLDIALKRALLSGMMGYGMGYGSISESIYSIYFYYLAGYGPIYLIYGLAMVIPGLAVGVRRLHDVGKSGWWCFIALIPLVGAIWLLVLFCTDSTDENEYGSNPKLVDALRKNTDRMGENQYGNNMFCHNCGKQVAAGIQFCGHCGENMAQRQKPAQAQTGKPTASKPFPWLVLSIALVLLLGIGGGVGYFNFYVPYKDKVAPRYYTFAEETFLRSSQEVSGNKDNILAKVPYGSELIVYDNSSDWSKVKWDGKKGYMSTPFILPKQDFYLLNSIFGDNDAKKVISTSTWRIALLDYFKLRGYYGVIEPQLAKSVFGVESLSSDRVWQVFGRRSTYYYMTVSKEITIKGQNSTLYFAVIITNIRTRQRKCLLFSTNDGDEIAKLEYEEMAPPTGGVVSVTRRRTRQGNGSYYDIKYR